MNGWNPCATVASPRRSGFSLLEMLVVVIIMGLLVALVAPRVLDNVGKAKVKSTLAQLESLTMAVDQFRLDMGRVPSGEEGLRVLLERPQGPDSEKWDGPYLEKDYIPQDGWDRAFEYDPGENGRFVIRSLGADGRPGGEGEDEDLDNRSS